MNKQVFLAGILASIVMGMVTMAYEGLFGAGFFAPVIFIAATFLRSLQTLPLPVPFLLLPVILGLMGHMMNSVILGVVFAVLISPRLKGRNALVLGGVVYSLIIFAMMWLIILPLIDPVMLKINGLVFAISHVMWGLTLGVMISKKLSK